MDEDALIERLERLAVAGFSVDLIYAQAMPPSNRYGSFTWSLAVGYKMQQIAMSERECQTMSQCLDEIESLPNVKRILQE